jgi:cytochrome c2
MLENRSANLSKRFVLLALMATLVFSGSSAEEDLPYSVKDGQVDQSTYLGWRVFHSTCHGCHGVDATGTSVAPDLVERIKRLSARDFGIKVLSRYRFTVSAQAASGDDKTELREEFLQQVMRRESGDILMPAWERDPNVKPHVLDIYAYLRARADGALAPGRPKMQTESK